MRPAPITTILGAGPIGLVAALVAARGGMVDLVAPRVPATGDPGRIESVPAAFLGLLLELGVHPRALGVSGLHDAVLTAWSSARPETKTVSAKAHLDRRALEAVLLDRVERDPRIRVTRGHARTSPAAGITLDATGRRAATAIGVEGPSDPWIARTFELEGRFSHAQCALRLAALPTGYAYRLGTASHLSVGLVFPRSRHPLGPEEAIERLSEAGAAWLLAGLDGLSLALPGRGGEVSVQWSRPSGQAVPVGDAALAYDALASQGLANGISDAIRSLEDPRAHRRRRGARKASHLRNLARFIDGCAYRAQPPWRAYAEFLSASMLAA